MTRGKWAAWVIHPLPLEGILLHRIAVQLNMTSAKSEISACFQWEEYMCNRQLFTYKRLQGFCYSNIYCHVGTVHTLPLRCRRISSDQWLWNCVPFCCQYLQNGLGLSYQSLCQNISRPVQSDQNFHGTHKLLMKTWINSPPGNWSSCTLKHAIAHGPWSDVLATCYCSSFIGAMGEAVLQDHVFKWRVHANTPCKYFF